MFDADGTYPAKSDGSDIRFSSDDVGDTPLNVEVERFGIDNDPANGYAEIWVRIPSFSHTVDTTVYCWWNDPDATAVAANDADEGSEGVWDANYKGVYHLSETENTDAGGYKDATANANHMTGVSTAMTAAAGAFAGSKCVELDGSADYLYSTTLPASDYPLTLSAWMYADVNNAAMGIVSLTNSAQAVNYFQRVLARGDVTNDPVQAESGDTTSNDVASKVGFTTAAWCHTAGTFPSATSRTAHVDGVAGTANTATHNWATVDRFCVGAVLRSGSLLPFNGKIDEVRASASARAAEWLAAEYAAINGIATITPGTPESPGGETNTGTGALTSLVTTASGAGVVSYIAAGALSIVAALCSGSGSVTYPGSGAPSTPAVTASGSGAVTYTGSGTPSTAATTASGTGSSTTPSSQTTNQAACTANRSIGEDDYNAANKVAFETAFAKITLPDLTGSTLTEAVLKVRLASGFGQGSTVNCSAYAKVCSTAWDESSNLATLASVEAEFNAVDDLLATTSISEISGTEFTFDIFGNAGKGLSQAYTADPSPSPVTVMLKMDGISVTSDTVRTEFTLGDEAHTDTYRAFYPRSDATYYPRITLTSASSGENVGTGALTVGAATASGAGVVSYVGTGALTTPVTTVSGYEANAGIGAPTSPQAIVSGVGAVIYTGSGTPSIPAVTATGLAATTYTATGALTTPLPRVWGIYDKSDVVIPLPEVAGEGAVTNQNIGALTTPVATASGTGSHSLITTDPDDGSIDGLNRDIASYSWKSINAKGGTELRRALYRLDLSNQQIVTNINTDITNIVEGTTQIHFRWKEYGGA